MKYVISLVAVFCVMFFLYLSIDKTTANAQSEFTNESFVEEELVVFENKLIKDNSFDIPGLKDTVTEETNLELTPKNIYDMMKYERARENIIFIRGSLASFAKLTESLDKSFAKEQKTKIGNMGWETQNLGFTNCPNHVEGVLIKQDYLIKRLEYELARQRIESGQQVSKDKISELKVRYKSSEKQMTEYFNAFQFAD